MISIWNISGNMKESIDSLLSELQSNPYLWTTFPIYLPILDSHLQSPPKIKSARLDNYPLFPVNTGFHDSVSVNLQTNQIINKNTIPISPPPNLVKPIAGVSQKNFHPPQQNKFINFKRYDQPIKFENMSLYNSLPNRDPSFYNSLIKSANTLSSKRNFMGIGSEIPNYSSRAIQQQSTSSHKLIREANLEKAEEYQYKLARTVIPQKSFVQHEIQTESP